MENCQSEIDFISTKKKLSTKSGLENSKMRLAVLIDADNAQAAVIDGLLTEIAKFGDATVKRIYGDFTSPASTSWKKVLQRFGIKPMQQFAYTTGKNATDSALIIDAMDLLYERKLDGFCLITSDSDFTGLAIRMREEGLTVFGFGEQKTPLAFRNACHKFIFTESILIDKVCKQEMQLPRLIAEKNNAIDVTPIVKTNHLIRFPKKIGLAALERSVDDQGWAYLGTFGKYLISLQPDFDFKIYGYKKLSELVKSEVSLFVTDERQILGSKHKNLYLRAK